MIVLIDDDKLIHLSWKLRASKANRLFESFYSIDEFLKSNHCPSDDLHIYIDSNLGNGQKGEYESKKLNNLGFKNIYLATGFSDLNPNHFPWLSGIISKSPPF